MAEPRFPLSVGPKPPYPKTEHPEFKENRLYCELADCPGFEIEHVTVRITKKIAYFLAVRWFILTKKLGGSN